MASGLLPAQTSFDVAGDGIIGDETLTTTAGQAALPVNGGAWASEGSVAGGGNTAESFLVSPAIEVPTTGSVTLKFDHRYFFETGWDGGAVFISVNGQPATYVAGTAFSANGYVGDTTANTGTAWTGGEEVFYGKSPGYDTPAFVESVADLGSLNAGDTISVEFRGIWDEGYNEPGTDWQISGLTLEDSLGSAFLNVDFVTDGPSDFTVVNNENVQNPFVYQKGVSTFEINADTLAADRYTPDIAGSVIDLNDARIAVKLLSGTLEVNDAFTLFDLSGGTTLTGNIGSLTLPPGLWDTSTLAVDGRIVLLLPGDAGPTAGVDFEVDARVDNDGDDIWEELIGTAGFEFYLDTASGVARTTTGSATQMSHAYDFPGGLLGSGEGTAGGAKLVTVGESGLDAEAQSFFQVGYHGNDATLEFWIRPDNLTPDAPEGQIIWEDGGGSGFGLFVGGGLITTSQDNGTDAVISYDVSADPDSLLIAPATTEFIQVVLTREGGTGATEMFINGQSVGTGTDEAGGWSGGDGTALGGRGEANTGGKGGGDAGTESFDGQIGLFRVYNQQILTQPEIQANFDAVAGQDVTPPAYTNLSPANLSTGVFFEDKLVATFTENIALTGNGSVILRDLATSGETVIPLPDAQVSVAGNQLVIDPTTLVFDTNYAVLISADAIVDWASTPNAFAGITDDTRWTFTTDPQDLTDPAITSLSPADDETGVGALDSLVVTFDETVVIAAGDITLKNLTNGTEFVIDITDSTQVSHDDNVLTIRPVSTLGSESAYAVRIAAGAITDISGNTFDGIADDTTWSFTTGSFPGILFADNFNRPDSADLNASTAGKAGLLGALNWGSGTLNALLDINNNTMRTDNDGNPGSDGAWAWVEHNFTELQSMTVTFDITAQNSGGDGRVTGFRMGQSLADISGEDSTSTSGNAADVAVYRDNVGATRGVRVYEGATDLGYISVPDGLGTLSATFTFADMNAGTALNYEIFWNGASVTTGSTTWSGTNENYVSLQSNTTADTRIDNFVVAGVASEPGTPGDYGTWADLFPGADLVDPTADLDGDGVSNNDERLFGLDPTDSSSLNPMTVPFDKSTGTFSFTRRDNALTEKLADIETSPDLVTWTVDPGAVLTEPGAPDGNGVEVVDVVLSSGLLSADKLFIRVNQNDGTTPGITGDF